MRPNGRTSYWTDEHVETLRKLHAEGLSFSMIAAELGGFSRSAVIGKAFRLGLMGGKPEGRRSPSVSKPSTRHRRNYSPLTQYCGDPDRIKEREAKAAIKAEFYATEVADLTDEQRARAVTFEQLGKMHCKWGYGDPRKTDFVFCGCDRVAGEPYCAPHMRIASNRAVA